jgi:hypothetical protein
MFSYIGQDGTIRAAIKTYPSLIGVEELLQEHAEVVSITHDNTHFMSDTRGFSNVSLRSLSHVQMYPCHGRWRAGIRNDGSKSSRSHRASEQSGIQLLKKRANFLPTSGSKPHVLQHNSSHFVLWLILRPAWVWSIGYTYRPPPEYLLQRYTGTSHIIMASLTQYQAFHKITKTTDK